MEVAFTVLKRSTCGVNTCDINYDRNLKLNQSCHNYLIALLIINIFLIFKPLKRAVVSQKQDDFTMNQVSRRDRFERVTNDLLLSDETGVINILILSDLL